MKIDGGYILISRKIVESEIFSKPPLYLKVWIYLLTLAQHKDYKGLKRGQLRTSIPQIQSACAYYIGYRKVVPSKDQVFKIIDWLRHTHESDMKESTKGTMITTTKATHGMLINIDKYCIYQDAKNYEANTESVTKATTEELRKKSTTNNINKNDIRMEEKEKGSGAPAQMSEDELEALKARLRR